MEKDKINKAIVYDQFGIDVLCARKLKEIISPIGSEQFTDQEIFICDKEKAYGIIVLNKPMQLDGSLFNNHFSRHVITEFVKASMWPGIIKFNAFSFRIKKIFKEPLTFIYKGKEELVMGKFVEGLDIIYKDVSEYEEKLEVYKNIEANEEDKELQTLFLELYKLFIERVSEKAQHNPAEDARRRARRNRKKKPKKKVESKG